MESHRSRAFRAGGTAPTMQRLLLIPSPQKPTSLRQTCGGIQLPLLHWATLQLPKTGTWPPPAVPGRLMAFVVLLLPLFSENALSEAGQPLHSAPGLCQFAQLPFSLPSLPLIPQHKTTLPEPVSLYVTFQAHLITDTLKIKHLSLNLFCVGGKKMKVSFSGITNSHPTVSKSSSNCGLLVFCNLKTQNILKNNSI